MDCFAITPHCISYKHLHAHLKKQSRRDGKSDNTLLESLVPSRYIGQFQICSCSACILPHSTLCYFFSVFLDHCLGKKSNLNYSQEDRTFSQIILVLLCPIQSLHAFNIDTDIVGRFYHPEFHN